MIAAYVTLGVGVLLLVAVLLVVLGRVRRFSRAAGALRGGLDDGRAALPALRRRVNP